MNDEMIFADGMGFKDVPDNAPETVRGNIWFNANKFIDFLNKHKDERGFMNTKMMKSKEKGTIYFILDTWKPTYKKEDVDSFAKEVNELVDTSKKMKDPETGRDLSLDDIGF